MNIEHTPGPREVVTPDQLVDSELPTEIYGSFPHLEYIGSAIKVADAALIAEAGTVTNECGLTPRELLQKLKEENEEVSRLMEECKALEKQKDELLKALESAIKFIKQCPRISYDQQPRGIDRWDNLVKSIAK